MTLHLPSLLAFIRTLTSAVGPVVNHGGSPWQPGSAPPSGRAATSP